MSTISLLGCSTSVALTTDPTDEEEEEEVLISICPEYFNCIWHIRDPDSSLLGSYFMSTSK